MSQYSHYYWEYIDGIDAMIPNSISNLKSLKYLYTNAKHSDSLNPYLQSLKKFGNCRMIMNV